MIDRAKGILNQYRISDADAFDVLRRRSHQENRKLRGVARQVIVETIGESL